MAIHEVLITGALHQSAIDLFHKNPALNVKYHPDCSRRELLRMVSTCQVLISRSETDVDQEVIEKASQLKIIARAAVGVGNIDIDFATERGILVINCPGKNTNSAAELTMGLILSMMRNIPAACTHLKSGGWDRHRFVGRELKDKTLGIVGLGNVGHRVSQFARGFDMNVLANDPYISPEVFRRNKTAAIESLAELVEKSDIVTVHVPLNKETSKMINASVFSKFRTGSYFVNAARGGIADEVDLAKALSDGTLAGAAIDTFQGEPSPMPELINNPKVWCTPHIGASTDEAQIEIGRTVYEQVVKALLGGVVDYPVNLPGVGIPDKKILKSYSILAEKLGSMIGQIIDFNPYKMQLSYRGDIAGEDTSLIRLSLMKGYAGHVADDYISFVNAEAYIKKLGIKVEETDDAKFSSYKSAFKILVLGKDSKVLSIGGVVFDERYIRISLLNDFYFEFDPVGSILMIENHDRPGVIGDVGHFLAEKNINIDSFALSRNKRGEKAMALVRVDSEVPPERLEQMRAIENVINVKSIVL